MRQTSVKKRYRNRSTYELVVRYSTQTISQTLQSDHIMRSTYALLCFGGLLASVAGFGLPKPNGNTAVKTNLIDRREALIGGVAGLAILTGATTTHPRLAVADGADKGKIVVFGGSGYVGAHVDQLLTSQGYTVVSVSRSSPADQAEKIGKILGKPLSGVQYATLDASSDDLGDVLKGATAVVSCVGIAPGGANQRDGNGKVNVRIADAAKAAGISRFVYIGVASDLANGPAKFLLGDYLKGKAEAEAGVLKDFGSDGSLVVKPAIIAGGPPGEIRPPGPPGVKAVAVEDVAKAVVAGALGQKSGTLDGNSVIVGL